MTSSTSGAAAEGFTAREIEQRANNVVVLITKFIDHVRECKHFAAISIKNLLLKETESSEIRSNEQSALESVHLYQHLLVLGFVDKVNESLFGHSAIFQPRLSWPSTNDLELDRQKLVYEILLPILSSLAYWYGLLDDLGVLQDGNSSIIDRGNSRKPTPPIGMLSLSNYTDIACLLEFVVCSSILPHLETNVLTPSSAEDRSKSLPKTMAGRIPKRSLQWSNQVHHEYMLLHMTPKERKQAFNQAKFELMDTVIVLYRVLSLDRFRHILLKRHITDLFAAIFQAEHYHYIYSNNDQQENLIHPSIMTPTFTEWMKISRRFVPNLLFSSPDLTSQLSSDSELLDRHLQAQSYQFLLLSGKNSPNWLKNRVGPLLTELAISGYEGLQAIIDVFVVAANNMPTDEITRASSRLGRVLCCSSQVQRNAPLSHEIHSLGYNGLLLKNMSLILEYIGADRFQRGHVYDDVRAMATVLTCWSLLDNISTESSQRHFFGLLIEGLIPTEEDHFNENVIKEDTIINNSYQRIERSLSRIYALFLFPQSTLTHYGGADGVVSRLCRFFISPLNFDELELNHVRTSEISLDDVTALSLLLRIVEAGERSIVSCVSKDMARIIFHMILEMILTRFSFEAESDEVTAVKVLAVSLIKCIMLNTFDLTGWSYAYSSSSSTDKLAIFSVYREPNHTDFQHHSECRTEALIAILTTFLPLKNIDATATDDGTDFSGVFYSLPLTMFQLLLLIYLQYISASSSCDVLIPRSLIRCANISKLGFLHLFNLLCEKIPLEKIIANSTSGDSVIRLLHLILHATSGNFTEETPSDMRRETHVTIEKNIDFSKCDLFSDVESSRFVHPYNVNSIQGESGIVLTKNYDYLDDRSPEEHNEEAVCSLLSIVMTFLIAILELDSSNIDCELLYPIVPLVSQWTSPESTCPSLDSDLSRTRAELAEMASHAMALIACRQKPTHKQQSGGGTVKAELSIKEIIRIKIDSAAKDLLSVEAPMRARGIVTLRHLARSCMIEKLFDQSSNDTSSTLTFRVCTDSNDIGRSRQDAIAFLGDMLDLSLQSLQDSESYVFLAGIQTLVVIADVMPYYVVPVLTDTMCTGVVSFTTSKGSVKIQLSSPQRIKLTEALLFIIRRRGKAINQHGVRILSSMLHGKAISPIVGLKPALSLLEQSSLVQASTFSHFQESNLYLEDTGESASDDLRQKILTGGPIFQLEEDDLQRSSCIHVACELVVALSPNIVAQYCSSLCRLAINSLHLDSSRIIRRAAASLCKCLYMCASTEVELMEQNIIPEFTIAIVSCDEELLYSVLSSCLTGNDVDTILPHGVRNRVKGQVRLYDEATVARCKEAIDIRENLQSSGYLDIARTIAQTRADRNSHPIVRLLQNMGPPTPNLRF